MIYSHKYVKQRYPFFKMLFKTFSEVQQNFVYMPRELSAIYVCFPTQAPGNYPTRAFAEIVHGS